MDPRDVLYLARFNLRTAQLNLVSVRLAHFPADIVRTFERSVCRGLDLAWQAQQDAAAPAGEA
jgi:hypothetical protein